MFTDYEAALQALVESMDFDISESVEKARIVLLATTFLLAARPSGMSQIGANISFDNQALRDFHQKAQDFLKARKKKAYKSTFLRKQSHN
jgi:hypothetical protein